MIRWLRVGSAVLLALNCCGYSTRSLLPPHLRTVAIAAVENSTTQPGLAELLNDALSSAFHQDRNLRVTNVENADLVVTVTITGYTRTAAAYDARQNISLYELTVAARVEAEDQVRDETFFSGTVSGRVTYDPNSVTEEAATPKAIAKLAAEIVRQVVTAW